MSDSRITPALLAAYRQAEYIVQSSPSFILRVDVYSARLNELHRQNGVNSSAVITACNPHSEQADAAINALAVQKLRQDLETAGCVMIDCTGHDPQRHWPDEPGYLAIGLDLDKAERLGAGYGQNAILFSDDDAIPRLVVLE